MTRDGHRNGRRIRTGRGQERAVTSANSRIEAVVASGHRRDRSAAATPRGGARHRHQEGGSQMKGQSR